jgi:TonB family protein
MYVRTLHWLGTLSCALGFFNSALAVVARANEPTALPLVEPRLLVPRKEYYPVLSRRLGEAGRVLLRYRVDANGRPESVSVALSESARLEAAAITVLEDAVIENGGSAELRGSPKVWELTVLFELDPCGKRTRPDPKATVVTVCGKRSIVVSESGPVSRWTPDQPPGDVALREATQKAEKGDLDQQRWLCSQFAYWNRITDPHPDNWCEMGARVGDPYSEAMLADFYYVGRGVSLDYERAFQLYRDAAARGLDFAQSMLGAMYILGERGARGSRHRSGLAAAFHALQSGCADKVARLTLSVPR